MHEVSEQEVHRTETKNCEGVAREDQERLLGHREDGRDGIDGEDDVGHLDDHNDGKTKSTIPIPTILYHNLLQTHVCLTAGQWLFADGW